MVTSYSVVTSEFGAFTPDAKDESKSKAKKKQSQDNSDDEDDDDGIQKRLKAASKRGKQKDALFRVKWWRVVLGELMSCTSLQRTSRPDHLHSCR